MTSIYTEGAAALDRFAVQFKSIIDLADVLRGAGSAEQAAAEAVARHAKATAEEQAVQAKLSVARDALTRAIDDAEAVAASAKEQAAAIVAKAEADALALRDAAREEFAKAKKAVEDEIASVRAAWDGEVAKIQEGLKEKRTVFENLVTAIEAKALEHDTLTAKLDTLRERVASFLKG